MRKCIDLRLPGDQDTPTTADPLPAGAGAPATVQRASRIAGNMTSMTGRGFSILPRCDKYSSGCGNGRLDGPFNPFSTSAQHMTDARSKDDRDQINADDARDAAERWRVRDAAAQAGAEGHRQVAEGARVHAEQRRDDNEALRVIAEHVRELRGEMRASSEQAREVATALRSAAEDMRLAAEGVRAASEDARVASAEQRKLLREMQDAARSFGDAIRAHRVP